MAYGINTTCKLCKHKNKILPITDTMFGNHIPIRCKNCNNVYVVSVPKKEIFLKKETKINLETNDFKEVIFDKTDSKYSKKESKFISFTNAINEIFVDFIYNEKQWVVKIMPTNYMELNKTITGVILEEFQFMIRTKEDIHKVDGFYYYSLEFIERTILIDCNNDLRGIQNDYSNKNLIAIPLSSNFFEKNYLCDFLLWLFKNHNPSILELD